jgi:DNA-binding response OmpR family regulator
MKKKVLVVDDNEGILDVVKMALNMAGYDVCTSLNGRCFQQMHNGWPDLILLDVLLSGENGDELCQRLKGAEQTKNIPVILISAHGDLRKTAEQCGADDILVKPFRLTELREIVKNHLH